MRKIFLLLIPIYTLSFGQTDNDIQIEKTIDMFPKAPDVAALSKYVDIPPGSYTGVADFTIPIYTINISGYQIPIELRYTTTGIKVGEIASRVGLGWSLNTGAFLSQQVIGNHDKKFKKPVLQSADDIGVCILGEYDFNDPCGIAFGAVDLNPSKNFDLKPDIFTYGLLNSGGHFIMDYSSEFGIPMPYNLTKIIPHGTAYIENIELIDEQGVSYVFDPDISGSIQNFNTCSIIPNDVNQDPNFKINTIKFPDESKVKYTYSKATRSQYITSISEEKIIYAKINTSNSLPLTPERCINYTVSIDPALSEINFGDGKVLFYYNNDAESFTETVRQDLYSPYPDTGDVYLTRVIVKDKHNHTIKDISFSYDYFTSDEDLPSFLNSYSSFTLGLKKRLKLLKVKDNLSFEEYKLSYYGDDNGLTLPHRVSYSQDFWGVYNGKINTTSIATVKATVFNQRKKVYLGANKEPDITYGIIGNLRKIENPAGGYTEITYEADDYVKQETVPPLYAYQSNLWEPYADDTAPLSDEFIIPENTYNQILKFVGDVHPDGQVQNGDCFWKLHKKNELDEWDESYDSGRGYENERYDAPGTYRLQIIPNTEGPTGCYAEYGLLIESVVDDSPIRKTGTIRIKKIELNSINNGKIIRNYTYLNPTMNYSQTSGKNLGDELLVPISYKEISIGPEGQFGYGRTVRQLSRVNNPGWQTATVRGKAIGYDYVQEIYESSLNQADNYKKEYKFNNDPENAMIQYQPYSPINFTWPVISLERGLLEEETMFNNVGYLIRKKKYEYIDDAFFNQYATMNLNPTPYNTNIAKGLEIQIKTMDIGYFHERTYTFNKKDFEIPNIWIKNIKTTTTDYVNNQPKLETVQTTAYSTSNTNRHTFPTGKITTVTGSNETISQSYQYAYELNQTYLKNKNIIGIPLITEVKKNGETISKTEVVYPISEADAKSRNIDNKDIPVPFDVLSLVLGSSEMKKTIVYNKYDGSGNLVQYTMNPIANGSGTPVTIIWGYNKTQPIAKVEGATYAQVSSLATSIINASNTDANSAPGNDESALLSVLNTFRTNSSLNGYQITTYSYDPLIGVRSITPPSGITEFYHYDTAGRLKEIKDINGNVLKEFKYNYKH